MVDESTLNLTVILHGTTQTRCIVVPKAKNDALITLNNISCCFFRSFTIVVHLNFCESTATFHPKHSERKQDLTPTNQNTRSKTRRHSTSCIFVPRHGRGLDNQSRRLKPSIYSIFTSLDPFYHPHFAFSFGLPAVPHCRGGPNVQRWIYPTTHPPTPSSMVHPSSYVATTATTQGPHRI
jgi:hypothetical protein